MCSSRRRKTKSNSSRLIGLLEYLVYCLTQVQSSHWSLPCGEFELAGFGASERNDNPQTHLNEEQQVIGKPPNLNRKFTMSSLFSCWFASYTSSLLVYLLLVYLLVQLDQLSSLSGSYLYQCSLVLTLITSTSRSSCIYLLFYSLRHRILDVPALKICITMLDAIA